MPVPITCPDISWWRELLDGGLSEREHEGLVRHLDACTTCRRTVEELAAESGAWPSAARHLGGPARADPVLRRLMDDLKASGTQPAPAAANLPVLGPPRRPGDLGTLAAYDVIAVIGRGGMGVVLKAFDPALERTVAVKVLSPQWASSEGGRERFGREARAMAAVRHEHVVAVHAVSEADGFPYLVMEHVQGGSLQQRLDREGAQELEDIVRIGAETAAGLAAAHEQGLIHRDVKPANILLEYGSGRVKLTDFGLARAADDASLTQSGVISGTPLYMSPEQARGETVDPRSDLFSLGSVVYALCTGEPPFQAAHTLAVLKCVSEATPRAIPELNPEIPAWLVDIVGKLHAKKPAARFRSAAEVRGLLAAHLGHMREPARVPPPPRLPRPGGWRRRLALAGVGLLVLVAAGLLWWYWPGGPGSGPAQPPAGNGAVEGNGPRVVLANGRAFSELGARLAFQVDYRVERHDARAVRYFWVVRSAGRVLHEEPVLLLGVGTLRGRTFRPVLGRAGLLETHIEADCVVPGQIGWQRRTVSNTTALGP
jgi:serine/threonine-protein kinase